MSNPKPVIIESPYAGKNPVHYRRNIAYLHRIIQDCLARGEVPYGSHGFFPGALDDTVPEQRKAGIEAGFKTAEFFHALGGYRIFCRDRGTSTGMVFGEQHASSIGMLSIDRSFGPEWSVEADPVYCDHAGMLADEYLKDGENCGLCGTKFRAVTLPEDAIAVALEYLRKKA